jgi:hypothetical protein
MTGNLLGGAARLRTALSSSFNSHRAHDSGTAKARVFCFGQSNSTCLRAAWERRMYRPSDASLDFRFLITSKRELPSLTSGDTIAPILQRAFDEHDVLSGTTEAWLVSIVGGNAYNVYGLFEPAPLFDFVHPDCQELPLRKNAPVLPYDAVRAVLATATNGIRRFYRSLPRRNITGVIHVEAPPPIPSQKQCERSIEGLLLRRSLGVSWGVRVSPREFRLKLWRTQCDITREMCREHDLIYVEPPEQAFDPEGYLQPKAWFGATHASAWYGALALEKIEAIIRAHRRTS